MTSLTCALVCVNLPPGYQLRNPQSRAASLLSNKPFTCDLEGMVVTCHLSPVTCPYAVRDSSDLQAAQRRLSTLRHRTDGGEDAFGRQRAGHRLGLYLLAQGPSHPPLVSPTAVSVPHLVDSCLTFVSAPPSGNMTIYTQRVCNTIVCHLIHVG